VRDFVLAMRSRKTRPAGEFEKSKVKVQKTQLPWGKSGDCDLGQHRLLMQEQDWLFHAQRLDRIRMGRAPRRRQ
jgi:hypothetical protein